MLPSFARLLILCQLKPRISNSRRPFQNAVLLQIDLLKERHKHHFTEMARSPSQLLFNFLVTIIFPAVVQIDITRHLRRCLSPMLKPNNANWEIFECCEVIDDFESSVIPLLFVHTKVYNDVQIHRPIVIFSSIIRTSIFNWGKMSLHSRKILHSIIRGT